MKFRLLFILFNFVVIVAFALVVFMPLLVLGWEYSQAFWRSNWPVAIIFAVVLGGLNTYFGVNWRLFTLLEREDWEGLIAHLEKKVIQEGRPGRQRIRVLINAYVITGSADRIQSLEHYLREEHSSWVRRFPLEFGLPYLLEQNAGQMVSYFGEMKENPRTAEQIWVRWNYAFALLLKQKGDDDELVSARHEAVSILRSLVGESRDPVQQLLIAYLLDAASATVDDDARKAARELRDSLRSRFSRQRWEQQVERRRSGLQELVLAKLIKEASSWAFDNGEGRDA